jgi:DNA recombination protein RmuC
LEPVTQIVGGVQLELKGLSERVARVEQNQNMQGQNIQALGTGLAQTSTATASLIEATTAIRSDLSKAKDGLTELQSFTKARHDIENRTAESIRRLETIIAGTQTKGIAGENILEFVFAKLPAEWQVRNFRVGNKAVEFGLRLPNNLILPIDSKWTATNLIEQFVNCDNPDEQQKLKSQIESAVLSKAKEVKKYIDPSLTVNFGIAAVPDAVYDSCYGIQTEIFQLNVVLVSYSMFLPYLLLVFQTILKTSQNIDLEKLDAYLQMAQENIVKLQEELEGRFARAITMLNNSRTDMSTYLSKVSGGLTNLQGGVSTPKLAASPEQGSASEQASLL